MYYSTSRVLAVLDLLQTHGKLRSEDIAARLEVDARTVRRYVMILRDRGVPVEMKRGRYGGYSLPPGYKAPLALTKQEALALTYGLLREGQQALGLAESDSARTLKKFTRVLPSATRELIQNLDGAVTFATPRPVGTPESAPESAPDYLEVIVQAIQARQRIRIRHHAQSGAVTERDVDPYQVVYRAGRWYLVGYCHLRAGQRVFRLDHVRHARALPETFAHVATDALAAVEQAIAQAPWRWEYQVIAQAPLAEIQRRLPATVATTQPHEQGTLLHGFADDLDWLAYVLAGLRCPIVIVRPPELRAHFLALAEHIRSIAASPGS